MDDRKDATMLGLAVIAGLMTTGCTRGLPDLQPYVERPLVVAVAPALNHSGSQDFDPVRVADYMVSELTNFGGVKTVPLNRVLAHLDHAGHDRVESPGQALDLARRMGADRMLVFAITEYDPYDPPVVGITAQLYGSGSQAASRIDPVAASRRSVEVQPDIDLQWPQAEYQRLFNGQDESVRRAIRAFARQRDAEDSPHGWRKFMATQEDYLRFCCHMVLRELIRQEVAHVAPRRERSKEGSPP